MIVAPWTSLDLSRESTLSRFETNGIGAEGAKMISEVMKSNSTLTSLNLAGEEEKQKEKR